RDRPGPGRHQRGGREARDHDLPEARAGCEPDRASARPRRADLFPRLERLAPHRLRASASGRSAPAPPYAVGPTIPTPCLDIPTCPSGLTPADLGPVGMAAAGVGRDSPE